MKAMYLPRVAKLTKHELFFIKELDLKGLNSLGRGQLGGIFNPLDFLIEFVDFYINNRVGSETYDKFFNDKQLKTQRIGFSDTDFEIGYKFSSKIRPTNGYGSKGWTYRLLYEYLCETYNNGIYFVDEYFSDIFEGTYGYRRLVELKRDVYKVAQQEHFNKHKGTSEVYLSDKKAFNRLPKQRQKILKSTLKKQATDLATFIKNDIIDCIGTGLLNMHFSLSDKTLHTRELLGITSTRPFYATTALVNDLQLFVRVRL